MGPATIYVITSREFDDVSEETFDGPFVPIPRPAVIYLDRENGTSLAYYER